MAATNLTEGVKPYAEAFDELVCSPSLTAQVRQQIVAVSAVNIFLAVVAFLGNSLILVALQKESSLRPPTKLLFRCLATSDLCVGLMAQPLKAVYSVSLLHRDWNNCKRVYAALSVTAFTLVLVSLLTLTAISIDRYLALSLGLRYRQVVTLKRTYIVVAITWIKSIFAAALYPIDFRITISYGYVVIPLCVGASFVLYTRIFRTLRHRSNEVQDLVHQTNSLNIARYRKAVYSALSVQLVLLMCYSPFAVVEISVVTKRELSSSYLLAWVITGTVVFLNSSLNPFLYCWKISEMRQAVKQTIRQAFYCPRE
ncbi:adenosine receptor A2a-like [Stylophora pistillata]|uniref:adenosine receptor A2a-like n=1 Tax=Stylophora pistillata TaxID=50429 RepID=UPI000C0409E4|nr:adenosine receptor A2a-like [Stylophora pistillata]